MRPELLLLEINFCNVFKKTQKIVTSSFTGITHLLSSSLYSSMLITRQLFKTV